MKFETHINESIFVSELRPSHSQKFQNDLNTGLSIVWNIGDVAHIMIDQELISVEKDCAVFFTEYHQIDSFDFQKLNVIQFNRPFYCVRDHDNEIGCKGLLFYSSGNIPKIKIPQPRRKQFELLWEVLLMEMEEQDGLKLEMLRTLLKRFLILFLRIYKHQNTNLPTDNISVGMIREFNYLVEQNYKQMTKVSDYAKLLHKSPKTLSNLFHKYIDKTPLQIINDRRLLEAKRLLIYTDHTIQEIGYQLNFKDGASFSHFFNSNMGVPPSKYRDTNERF